MPGDAAGLDALRAFLGEMGTIVDALDNVARETVDYLWLWQYCI